MATFNPETATIGGVAVLTIHLTVMAQIRRFIPAQHGGVFDAMNYPLAFLEMLLVNPPWPLLNYGEWRDYIGYGIATAAMASVAAKKVIDGKEKAE